MDCVLPAPSTKHVNTLATRLPRGEAVTLRQQAVESDNSRLGTTGTTLWLGAQVLAAYLTASADAKPLADGTKPRALELGAGVGYLALTVASLGYDVTATDIEPVLSRVLAPNVGAVATPAEVDWLDAVSPPEGGRDSLEILDAEYELVVTSDTIYAPAITPALWAAIERVCAPREGRKTPTLYIALERRDPRVVDAALEMGKQRGCSLRRVAQGRLVKAIERAGWRWSAEDWEGIEVWRGKWK